MTVGAHAVPVLGLVGPVQPVIRFDILSCVNGIAQMKPFAIFGIPGNGKTLEPSAVEGYEVLLQGSEAESMGDLEIAELTGRALCIYIKPAILHEHAVRLTFVPELKIIEITQYGGVVSHIHGKVMMRAKPQIVFFLMTFDAGTPAHKLSPFFDLLF
jgi:hypothetical protein